MMATFESILARSGAFSWVFFGEICYISKTIRNILDLFKAPKRFFFKENVEIIYQAKSLKKTSENASNFYFLGDTCYISKTIQNTLNLLEL